MAPKSGWEAGGDKEEAISSPGSKEPASGPLRPPAGTPADLAASECLKDTKGSSTRMDLQLAPESLDPRTLRLLLGQRELEIKALRHAIRNQRDARHRHVLQEVAGFPPQRSSCSQEKLLQAQVQKLTLEVEEQKEQAQQEKEHLEEQLLQTRNLLQKLEAELQALHRSCLRQLACSSWVGRMLKSSTGSVEVVTAETLIDPSDSSEDDEVPAQEGFRLEDVDWNSIAHRYPNLFTNIKSISDYRHPWAQTPPQLPPDSPPDESGSEGYGRGPHLGRVVRSCQLFAGASSSGGPNSDMSSCQLDEHLRVQKVTGHPPRVPGHISFQHIEMPGRRFSRDSDPEPEGPAEQETSQDVRETDADGRGKAEGGDLRRPAHPWGKTGSCLKIVAGSPRKKFVRILNESREETADLGGFMLQQLLRDFPVCVYHFPPHTLLEPRHHVTVWGEGPGSSKKQPPSSVGQDPVHFHSSPSFVTLLLSPKGEVFSKYRAPHCVTPASRTFHDNTNLSIDRFPLPEAQPGANTPAQRRQPRAPRNCPRRAARPGSPSRSRRPGLLPTRPAPLSRAGRGPHDPSPRQDAAPLPRLSSSPQVRPREEPAPPERSQTDTQEALPAIPQDRTGPADTGTRREQSIRVCRKTVDLGCPMVALSVRSRAGRRFGFRFPSCPPVTAGAGRRG